jgi:hypothetical protein
MKIDGTHGLVRTKRCRQRVTMIQNENITCSLHAVGRRRGIISVVDCLVTIYPGALMRKDEGGGSTTHTWPF